MQTADGPYKENYGYDAFANMTERDLRHWTTQLPPYSASYQNGRNTAWQYDADGNATQEGTSWVTNSFDAAGQEISERPRFSRTLTFAYDGDGRRVKMTESDNSCHTTETRYYVRSSVLGGRAVSEFTPTWNWHQSFIFAGNQLLAIQTGAGSDRYVAFKHQSPSGSTEWDSNPAGTKNNSVELDPLRVQMAGTFTADDDSCDRSENIPNIFQKFGDANRLDSGCTIDGVDARCSEALRLVNADAATVESMSLDVLSGGANNLSLSSVNWVEGVDERDLGSSASQDPVTNNWSATVNVGISFVGHFEFAGGSKLANNLALRPHVTLPNLGPVIVEIFRLCS